MVFWAGVLQQRCSQGCYNEFECRQAFPVAVSLWSWSEQGQLLVLEMLLETGLRAMCMCVYMYEITTIIKIFTTCT